MKIYAYRGKNQLGSNLKLIYMQFLVSMSQLFLRSNVAHLINHQKSGKKCKELW
jgi:hypothetical protein